MTHRTPEQIAELRPSGGVFVDSAEPCANGMPGHPPCRSVEELNELLRRREAAGEIA